MARERDMGNGPQLAAFDALHVRIEHLHGRLSEVLSPDTPASDVLLAFPGMLYREALLTWIAMPAHVNEARRGSSDFSEARFM